MKGRAAITVVAAALVFFSGYAALFIAPDESTMHEIQRVFYFHIGLWTGMYTALGLAFVANVAWLITRQPKWDWLGVSAVEVAVVCCTGGLSSLGCCGESLRGESGGRGTRASRPASSCGFSTSRT